MAIEKKVVICFFEQIFDKKYTGIIYVMVIIIFQPMPPADQGSSSVEMAGAFLVAGCVIMMTTVMMAQMKVPHAVSTVVSTLQFQFFCHFFCHIAAST